ncbi:N-acetylglucosamine-6-phosphate deacetylase [Sphingomonas jinjuensis]|uniref:N-acetylglucosamine-6-phosphate deacetylase n=1 Tax=Sphingomonas jinjuensis TaxID=535907 RepID=A0A840F868_9SPHN|nr:N-acetylglucosamine-6-phosphate deacetylase [Sphingomonas jinjuensis]MBB4153919.1 N-acetylglucosamine-6-phosphate deacetylase [Sphingomonas jinjuensis]
MTTHRFANGHVITAHAVLDAAAITVDADRITTVEPLTDSADAVDLDGGWIFPGFIDTQVNGGGSVLFNDDTSVDGIAAIGTAHARFGTTGFLPTLISDHPDRIALALEASDAAIAAGVPGVLGVHIEGPFLAPARKGIHDEARFRRLDDEMVALLTRPHRGTVMVTIAPELAEPRHIAALHAAGVRVSAGHTEVDYDGALAAFDAGVTGITHLFNAMHPMLGRAPGLVGAALDDERPWCGIIVDGVHVSPTMLRIAIAARGPDGFMLVTDAMPSVGAAEKDFMLQGRQIRVADGICSYADGTLAGSDLDMAQAVANSVHLLGLAPDIVARMASANPAAFLGRAQELGTLAPGQRADWVQLAADFTPRGTWIEGKQVA